MKLPWSDPFVGWVKGTVNRKKWFSDHAAAFVGNPKLEKVRLLNCMESKILEMCRGKLVQIKATGRLKTISDLDKSMLCSLFSNGVMIQKRYFDYAMKTFKAPKFYCIAKEPLSVVIKENYEIVGCVMKVRL